MSIETHGGGSEREEKKMIKRNVLKQEAEQARALLARLGVDALDLDGIPDTAARVIASIVEVELALLETEREREAFERSFPKMLTGVIEETQMRMNFQYGTVPTRALAALFEEFSETDYWNPVIRRLAKALADSLQTSVEIGDAARTSSAARHPKLHGDE